LFGGVPVNPCEIHSLDWVIAPAKENPMFDPGTWTLGQISSVVRDLAIVVVVVKVAWGARGIYSDAKYFIKRMKKHMVRMERSSEQLHQKLDLALNNHMRHMAHDLKMLSGRVDDIAPMSKTIICANEAEGNEETSVG
jgi:hypothetical protein